MDAVKFQTLATATTLPGMKENPVRRIGTAEREKALALLKEHQAAGRIDLREFDLRAQHVAAALTEGDLRSIFADLQPPGGRRNPWLLAAAALGVVCVVLIAAVVVLAARGSSPETGQAAIVTSLAPIAGVPTSSTTWTSPPQSATGTTVSKTGSSTTSVIAGDPVQYLMDMKKLSDGTYWGFDTGPAKISGTSYTRSIVLQPYRRDLAFIEYDLGRKFTQLDAVLGVRDDSTPSDITMQFQLYADGTLINETKVKLGDTVPIHLVFDKPLRLRLQVTDLTGGGDRYGGVFGDLRVTR